MNLAEKGCGKDELLTEVRIYAAIKRLERRIPTAMDVDIVTRNPKRTAQDKLGNARLKSDAMAWPWVSCMH